MRHPASLPKISKSMYIRGLFGRFETAVGKGWHQQQPGAGCGAGVFHYVSPFFPVISTES
jgi:hypothetical protein